MKKRILPFLAAQLFCGSFSAQEKGHITLGVGDGASLVLLDAMTDVTAAFVGAMTGTVKSQDTQYGTPYFFAEYRYPVSEIVNVGLHAGYLSNSATYSWKDWGGTSHTSEKKHQYIVVMPAVDVRYQQKGMLRLYGNVMAGMFFESVEDTDGSADEKNFVFQISPIAVSYGDKIAGFAELGFGVTIFSAGIKIGL